MKNNNPVRIKQNNFVQKSVKINDDKNEQETGKKKRRKSLSKDVSFLESINQLNNNNINKKRRKTRCSIFPGKNGLESTLNDPVIFSLININKILIKQEADVLEAVTGCQNPNIYNVYGYLSNREIKYLFKCQEFSGCCIRFFCPIKCRQFDMKIKQVTDEKKDNNDFSKSYLTVYKPIKIPFLCLIRPEMKVMFSKNKNYLGTIKELFSLFNPTFEISDNRDKAIYKITTNCCQCGFLCRNNFLGKSEEVHFMIYKPKNLSKPIGDICKKSAESAFSIADDYSIEFPVNIEPYHKMLLIIAGVMIDYQFFEKRGNSSN